jgi:hypothetical protein
VTPGQAWPTQVRLKAQGLWPAARRMLLDGLARDADIFEVLGALASLHPRNDTFPGEVFLPECTFRGRQNAKLRYAVLAAAAAHGGTEPDLPDEVAHGRPTTSGSTPCTRRSPTSAPSPAGQASRCARHARTRTSAPAIWRHSA